MLRALITQIRDELLELSDERSQEFVRLNRKYPDGFKVNRNGEEVAIARAVLVKLGDRVKIAYYLQSDAMQSLSNFDKSRGDGLKLYEEEINGLAN